MVYFPFPGTSAVITVANAYTGQQLTLDDSNANYPLQRLAVIPTYQSDTCLPGFVWRLAGAADHVCVTTDIWAQTQGENKVAQAHILPGASDTCKQRYVWRLADPTDHVCVDPSSYNEAQWDNELKPSRLAAPLP